MPNEGLIVEARGELVGALMVDPTDEIFAIPTLVRKIPKPLRKIIGDLSNKEKVLIGLNLRAIPAVDEK